MNYMDYPDDVAMLMFTKGQSRRMDACMERARASFLAAPAFALTRAGTGPAPASTTAAPTVTPSPHPSTPELAAGPRLLRLSPTGKGSCSVSGTVERLRQDKHNAMLMLDDIRAALNGDSVNTTGG
ncbi:hypothetical protein [Pseudarthrobacter sp. NBSH8]|uniref:hypothetical protein n=1 Tax=Pseudarthrobacter sp. NBSH8 TaxID=2596911 RepID=UPI0016292D93|nr:hypothetical protein [Pseudarthrobacter sp. NBSH8]QNE14466.1 hypothetical protein FYJ92_08485 [Pseudarthrobacter sp. NBSH8]